MIYILDRLFPWFCARLCKTGRPAEVARRTGCVVYPHSHMCLASGCMAWKWGNGAQLSWKRLFWVRRGSCKHQFGGYGR